MFDFVNEISDFKNTVNSYRYVVLGGTLIYVQGFQQIVSFSDTLVLLRLPKTSLKIYGQNLVIKDLEQNSISVSGKIESVVVGAEVK